VTIENAETDRRTKRCGKENAGKEHYNRQNMINCYVGENVLRTNIFCEFLRAFAVLTRSSAVVERPRNASCH